MFIKTTDSTLINLDAISVIYIDGTSVLGKARDATYDRESDPHTYTYTLGHYSTVVLAIRAQHELEISIKDQEPLHEMLDPDFEPVPDF